MNNEAKEFLDWMTDLYKEQGVDIQNIKPSNSHKKKKLNHFVFMQTNNKEFGKMTVSPVFASYNQKVGWYIYEFEHHDFRDKKFKVNTYKKYFNYLHSGVMTDWEEA